MDKIKITVALLFLAGGVVGFYHYSDQVLAMRVLGLLAMGGVALGIVFTTAMGRSTWSFVGDAQTEVKKVVWPTNKEAVQTTGIVLLMVFFVALFLWGLDSTLFWLVKQLTS